MTTPTGAGGGKTDERTFSTGAWARHYASRGFVVLPLTRRGNQPHALNGRGWHFCTCTGGDPTVGTRDPDVIDAWWQRDPEANLGVVAGAPSRLLILDVDVKHVDGHAKLGEWTRAREAEGKILPAHPSVASPHGGRHHWFLMPPGLEHLPRNDYFIAGVEVKACGGLVAVPPSTRVVQTTEEDPYTGALYEDTAVVGYRWEEATLGVDIPVAPGWLIEDVTTRREGAAWLHSDGEGGSADDELPATGKFIERGFWRPGSRNRDCFRLACRLYNKFGVNSTADDAVLNVIRKVWEQTEDRVDFSWDEAEYTARGARGRMERAARQERAKLDGYREVARRLRGGAW